MPKLKYILIFISISLFPHNTEALSIEYGKIVEIQNTQILIQYYGIEKKQYYLCDTTNLSCIKTRKKSLGTKKLLVENDDRTIEAEIFDINSYATVQNFTYDETKTFYISNTKNDPYNWELHLLDSFHESDTVVASNVSYNDEIHKVPNGIIFNQLQNSGYGPVIYDVYKKELQYFKIPGINTEKIKITEKTVMIENAHAVIMEPEKINYQKQYPLVIWLHGGPPRQTSLMYHPSRSYGIYDSMLRTLQKNNVIVLKLDYRGSFGYGKQYQESIKGEVGKGDVEDVLNAIDYAKQIYSIDKVYLMGNSYGGYLSLRTLAEKPNIISGVISINGVTDWKTLLRYLGTSLFNEYFNGIPNTENQNLYTQASIVDKTKNIGKQKIKIIHGTQDKTIFPWQADSLYKHLRSQKKNVSLIKYKNQDHVFYSSLVLNSVCEHMMQSIGIKKTSECRK